MKPEDIYILRSYFRIPFMSILLSLWPISYQSLGVLFVFDRALLYSQAGADPPAAAS